MGEPPSSLGGFHARQHDSLVISEMSKAAGGPGLSKEEEINREKDRNTVHVASQLQEQTIWTPLDKLNLILIRLNKPIKFFVQSLWFVVFYI